MRLSDELKQIAREEFAPHIKRRYDQVADEAMTTLTDKAQKGVYPRHVFTAPALGPSMSSIIQSDLQRYLELKFSPLGLTALHTDEGLSVTVDVNVQSHKPAAGLLPTYRAARSAAAKAFLAKVMSNYKKELRKAAKTSGILRAFFNLSDKVERVNLEDLPDWQVFTRKLLKDDGISVDFTHRLYGEEVLWHTLDRDQKSKAKFALLLYVNDR